MTIKQFAQKILEITGATGGDIYQDLPADDPKVRRSDIARALLGWKPKVDFGKGIRSRMINGIWDWLRPRRFLESRHRNSSLGSKNPGNLMPQTVG